jgi:hypothetical protein
MMTWRAASVRPSVPDALTPPPAVAEGVQRVIELLEAQAGLVDAEGAAAEAGVVIEIEHTTDVESTS